MTSLRNRIYAQNGIIIITLVLILEIIFTLFVSRFYSEGVKRELQNKLTFSATLYNKYLSKENLDDKITYILENESKNEYFYVELIDRNFNLLIDSNGFSNKKNLEYEDLILASRNSPNIIKYEDKESIISMSLPLYDSNNTTWAYLRYSTSIDKLKKALNNILQISIIIISLIIVITFFLSSVLANKILYPIDKIIEVSKKMAKGDFSQKIFLKNKDEIGKLGDTLNYMAEEINRSNTLKNEFISSISHELRTPLTAIKGWSELILTDDLKNLNDLKEGMSIISNETERLIVLVEDLLDFSKLESGKISLAMEKVDINKLIEDICYYFKNNLIEKQINLNLNLYEETIFIYGDKNRLKQVFINLIHNSIKFTDNGKSIYVNTKKEDCRLLVSIRDEGIGIPEDDLPKITEKFFKGSSKHSGSGIGLAICNEIITLHDAKLEISSTENVGTTILITFDILTEL